MSFLEERQRRRGQALLVAPLCVALSSGILRLEAGVARGSSVGQTFMQVLQCSGSRCRSLETADVASGIARVPLRPDDGPAAFGASGVAAASVAACTTAVAAALLGRTARRGSRTSSATALAAAAEAEVVGSEGFGNDLGMDSMLRVPDGGVPEEDKIEVPRIIYEGSEEVVKGERPSGQSSDPNQTYFWKMSQDKRTIDVIVPIDEGIDSKDIVYRIGEDPMDPMRGPTVELGYRVKDAIGGRYKETLLVDGQILNAINKQDTFWTLDEMGGCKVILLTLTRPSMMRFRHDPVLKRKTEEERIEPQTWDALLVDERIKPKITQTMFFDIALEGEPAGRIELGLFGDLLPKTVKNFAGLCTGEYVDDEGKTQKSAHCFKKTKFGSIMPNFLMSAGNPGKDIELVSFSQEELKEYLSFFEDFRREPVKVGKVERNWAIRWGSDLGTGEDADGNLRKEGGAVDGNSDKELQEIVEIMRTLVEKGNGASIFFFRPEWEKGCDMMGATFPAEGFMVPHAKRGMLSMDRSDTKDFQGSNFFITLKEFPHMDKRWVCFGEVTSGWDVIAAIEADYEGLAKQVMIEDCGLVA